MADDEKKDEEQEEKKSGEEKEVEKKSVEKESPKVDKAEYDALKLKLEELEGKQEKVKEEDLKKKEEFKTLWETEQEKGKKRDKILQDKELKLIAHEAGMIDPSDILSSGDLFTFDENFNVTNKDAGIKKLKESKPHYFGSGKKEVAATDTSMPNLSDIKPVDISKMTPEDYKKQRKKILYGISSGIKN